jgi:Peptidase family M28
MCDIKPIKSILHERLPMHRSIFFRVVALVALFAAWSHDPILARDAGPPISTQVKVGSSTDAPKPSPRESPSLTPNPLVANMIGQVQQGSVHDYILDLSGERPVIVGGSSYTITTRNTRSGTPIDKATLYAYERLQAAGLSVSFDDYYECGFSNRNVAGILPGATRPDEIVLITAHLDNMPSSGLAPGADDNASGSTGVLIAADIMSRYRFERTVRFIIFTGEEQGLCGSAAYATEAYNGPRKLDTEKARNKIEYRP